MLFHTVMIILHRPPSNMFEKPGISESEDVEICYESLQAILRLMRSYSRYYRYRSLPLDFAQTLSTATGVVMMKRFFQKSSWDDPEIERSLSLLTEAMDEIQHSLPCVKEIRDCVSAARQCRETTLPPDVPLNAPDLMNGLELGGADATTGPLTSFDDELGTLITDEFLSAQLQVQDGSVFDFEPFDFNNPPDTIDSRQ